MHKELINRAKRYIPGGVNSPVRAFGAVGGDPIFFRSGHGPYLVDVNDKQYIDYVGSWGPMILGHANKVVLAAVEKAIQAGLSFGACTEIETELAELICQIVPSIEQVRMVNSGTEATMSAIRLARGFTGRDKFIKFVGCYHGHADALLVKAGSGVLTCGTPSSAGVPQATTQDTLLADFNDLGSVEALFKTHTDDIACIILEPVAGNMNCIPPQPGFLQGLRQLCDQYGSLLIFDEVMTGFRVGIHGAQGLYNVTPDLTTLGKVIGGGMPVGAFGGRSDIMEKLAPLGPVYQAGTLSGNPIAMTAGLTTLKQLSEEHYILLDQRVHRLTRGIVNAAKRHGIAMTANHVGSLFGLFFTDVEAVTCYDQVMACNQEHFNAFFNGMLNQGVYLAPSSFEASFMSLAHHDDTINETISAAEKVFADVAVKTSA